MTKIHLSPFYTSKCHFPGFLHSITYNGIRAGILQCFLLKVDTRLVSYMVNSKYHSVLTHVNGQIIIKIPGFIDFVHTTKLCQERITPKNLASIIMYSILAVTIQFLRDLYNFIFNDCIFFFHEYLTKKAFILIFDLLRTNIKAYYPFFHHINDI